MAREILGTGIMLYLKVYSLIKIVLATVAAILEKIVTQKVSNIKDRHKSLLLVLI